MQIRADKTCKPKPIDNNVSMTDNETHYT